MTEQPRPPAAEFGAILKHEREMREVPLDEISKATRISKSMLHAMEEGRLDALPQGVFVKGFIRAYAESIGADPSGLVNRYVELCESPRAESRRDEEERRLMHEGNAVERRRIGFLFAAAAALALTAAALAVAFVARAERGAEIASHDGRADSPASKSETATAPRRRAVDVSPDSELSFEAVEAAHVLVEWNGEAVLQRALAPGESRGYPLHAPLRLTAEPGRALRLRLDGRPLPPVEGGGAFTLHAAHGKMEYGYDAAGTTEPGGDGSTAAH